MSHDFGGCNSRLTQREEIIRHPKLLTTDSVEDSKMRDSTVPAHLAGQGSNCRHGAPGRQVTHRSPPEIPL